MVFVLDKRILTSYINWQRLLGKKVIFVTGTDEHGEKIATAAAASGSSPSEHCDIVSQAYKTLWKDVNIFLLRLTILLFSLASLIFVNVLIAVPVLCFLESS